jgi:hypothetical protein
VFGVINDTFWAATLAVLSAVILYAFLWMNLAAHVLSKHQRNLLILICNYLTIVNEGFELSIYRFYVIIRIRISPCDCESY